MIAIVLAAVTLGLLTGMATGLGTRWSLRACELSTGRWPTVFGILGGILGALFVIACAQGHVQATPEVIPQDLWRNLRIPYHLTLIILLLMVTATDLRSYEILVEPCLLGMAIAWLGAVISGDFQLAHVWVDWNAEVAQLQGPYLPRWLSEYPHLHGAVWSAAGMLCGGLAIWLTRRASTVVLGRPTLGTGDIYLAAMIGAYLGWQPMIVVVVLAPLLAALLGALLRMTGNLPALPYGPFLALAALIVLFSWRVIWMAEIPLSAAGDNVRSHRFVVRRFFGDPIALLIVAVSALGLMLILLGLLRLYQMLPVRRSAGTDSRDAKDDS